MESFAQHETLYEHSTEQRNVSGAISSFSFNGNFIIFPMVHA